MKHLSELKLPVSVATPKPTVDDLKPKWLINIQKSK